MKRKELMQLYIENEIVRRGRAPPLYRPRVRDRIEGRIDFDHFEMLCVPGESLMRRHFFWVPSLDKSGIGPARGADENSTAIFLCSARRGHSLREPPQLQNANFHRVRRLRANYVPPLTCIARNRRAVARPYHLAVLRVPRGLLASAGWQRLRCPRDRSPAGWKQRQYERRDLR